MNDDFLLDEFASLAVDDDASDDGIDAGDERAKSKSLRDQVDDAALATCERVLTLLGQHRDALDTSRFKRLKRLGAVFNAHYDKIYAEQTMSKRQRQRQAKRDASVAEQRQRALDRKFRDNTAIRQKRILELEKLQAQLEPPALPAIAAVAASSHDNDDDDDEHDDDDGSVAVAPQQLSVIGSDGVPRYRIPQSCYVCKRFYFERHHFYDCLCVTCAAFNWSKRQRVVDLRGKVVLLTGGRIKIGFEAALKLLRCGATVHVTTRFPTDAARRFSQCADFGEWRERVVVHGLDLRDLKAVERFTDAFSREVPVLDALVNNAAQTVRRPPAFYAHLLPGETVDAVRRLAPAAAALIDGRSWHGATAERPMLQQPSGRESIVLAAASAASDATTSADVTLALSNLATASTSALMTQMPLVDGDDDASAFPLGRVDVDGQQLDLRDRNSWHLQLHEVRVTEAIEVHCVNALAPLVMCANLRAVLAAGARAAPDGHAYIVNVSAMEGKFYRFKTTTHAHTNMAKAALNMMTHTSARDYAADGILMNAVDTGWITDEHPTPLANERFEAGFQTPIDEIDAACRIVDPIMVGVGGFERDPATGTDLVPEFFPVERYAFGKFIKDYRLSEW
jgi:NAD(P)-dependent dehydrogenase (short-subunit alcohol dehydrogenase family)